MTRPDMIQWKVEGMTCANCALTINKFLQKNGAANVSVNAIDGDVSFEWNGLKPDEKIVKGIEALGYKVNTEGLLSTKSKKALFSNHLQRFLFCLPFTILLTLPMLPGMIHLHFLMNPYVQLFLTLPVYIVGMLFFGRSAINSIRNGILNMNVLIATGATLAFVYSLSGTLFFTGNETLFYETTATIITFVFFGNYLEEYSVKKTHKALDALVKAQKLMANMIAFDDNHKELIFPIENSQLKTGDLILIRTGEQIPLDAKILWGEAWVNESILSGESVPVHKKQKDFLIGGSIIEDGNVKAQVTASGNDTVLSGILNLVKKAQGQKPPVQLLADKISAIFVPSVLIIAFLVFIINWLVLKEFTPSFLRSITVLVIACPCAMGLATPAAIAVGLGRASRNGILFRNAKSLELFKSIKQVVFDKTGTLTTGNFEIAGMHFEHVTEEEFKRIIFSLEKYSNHPLAKSIVKEWKTKSEIRWKQIEEIKGVGMKALDGEGNTYAIGSFQVVKDIYPDNNHSMYVLKNGSLIGWIDLKDELRPEATAVISYLHSRNIKTILLSGDTYNKCRQVADILKLDEVIAEQSPKQKLEKIEMLTDLQPTIMVGDGINDGPALAAATIGISLSEASQLAVQSAGVVLMNNGLKKLPMALGLGQQTYLTIRQNLWWAFAYNLVAIPIAALGLLGTYGPGYGALIMALSDVILVLNSVLLFVKKVDH